MGNITLLELHVPEGDIQLGPKSLRSSKSDSEEEPVSEPTDESGSGRSLLSLLLLVVFLAAVGVMATKLLGEDADEEIAGFD
ncbi:hypothetical protein halTADL_0100 [Halohasta litchfieldiae]|jgi:hypothetical protein|uniref:Uncharacterized protein n=1 Tax=Halohasta litchfieldiae TaxID=1073996 RepID=A0A1H6T3R2_9EURY|nr:hypothetical protein [Halohasta litchfieldiae]ATW86922.1 hypothetical protein halTADL_0100 [Halohasta litchfieldiae]SEI70442.1 hypothetical protein SAMN05444271_10631 [Halohasta litchfieldiae]